MPARRMASGARPVMSAPSKTMRPRAGASRHTTDFSSEDLPAPLAPSRHTSSPARTVSDTPRSASTAPYRATTSVISSNALHVLAEVALHHGGVGLHLGRRALRDLLAVVEHHHAVGHAHDESHVVRSEEGRVGKCVIFVVTQ